MAVKIRCSVCRKTVVASPSAQDRQRVCCPTCRKERDRRLARKRRRADVVKYRVEAVERKRAQRARDRERQRAALTAEGDRASWQESGECHAPGSDDNRAALLKKIAKIVDEDFDEVTRQAAPGDPAGRLGNGREGGAGGPLSGKTWRCHALGSMHIGGKKTDEMIDFVAAVTHRDGQADAGRVRIRRWRWWPKGPRPRRPRCAT